MACSSTSRMPPPTIWGVSLVIISILGKKQRFLRYFGNDSTPEFRMSMRETFRKIRKFCVPIRTHRLSFDCPNRMKNCDLKHPYHVFYLRVFMGRSPTGRPRMWGKLNFLLPRGIRARGNVSFSTSPLKIVTVIQAVLDGMPVYTSQSTNHTSQPTTVGGRGRRVGRRVSSEKL